MTKQVRKQRTAARRDVSRSGVGSGQGASAARCAVPRAIPRAATHATAARPAPGGNGPGASDGLSDRQRLFVAAYCGNATDAARRVGFSAGHGRRLMALPRVRAAIAARQAAQAAELGKPAAAAAQAAINREDLQREWTRIMRDEGCKIMIRLKASELLARSLGMFTARPEPQTPQFQIVLEGMEPDDIR